MNSRAGFELGFEVGRRRIAYAHSLPADFILISGADAFERRAYFSVSFGLLVGSVEQAMRGQNQGGFFDTNNFAAHPGIIFSTASISFFNTVGSSTTPLPMTLIFSRKIPEGIWCNTCFFPSNSRVCPALGPP